MTQLDFGLTDFGARAVSPFLELGAYEALWDRDPASFKSLAARFAAAPGSLPSDFVPPSTAMDYANRVHLRLKNAGIGRYGVRVHGAGDYPQRLRDAEYPVELLYYQGWWDLVNAPRSVAVVGTRNPSEAGKKRARRLVRALLDDNITIVSGLAKGIDAEAHDTAIREGGHTIAVLGTPISHFYPSENAELQREIAKNHLLISQVPVMRYDVARNPVANNHFFPARNITMSALTDATIIVEAGETSGTLVQARAALKQNRKLFILDSCFQDPKLKWPHRFIEKGAIRVRDYDDIRHAFIPPTTH
jgi:DNA processing protein